MKILACPECGTNYDLPCALPDKGTKVRCMSCSHVWFATNKDLVEPEEAAPEAEMTESAVEAQEEAEAELQAESGQDSAEAGDEVAPVSPFDDDPLEEIDFNEILEEAAEMLAEEEARAGDNPEPEEAAIMAQPEPGDDVEGAQVRDELEMADLAAQDELEEETGPRSQDDIDHMFDELDGGGDEEAPSETNDQAGIDDLFAVEDKDEEDLLEVAAETEPQPEEEGLGQDDLDALFAAAEEAEEDEKRENEPSDDVDALDEADEVDPFDQVKPVEDFGQRFPTAAVRALAYKVPFWKVMDQKTMVGWACYGLALFFMGLFFISARVPVVKAFPAMANIYEALGLGVNVRGVMFTNVQQRWDTGDNMLRLKVDGEIVNLTNKYKALPQMVFVALNENRDEVFRWVAQVRKKPLLPGEKAPFIAKVPAPPETAKYLILYFQS